MRFFETEPAGMGHKRYLFAVGKAEALILHALLQKATQYMPKTPLTQSTHLRMDQMKKVIRKAIPQIKLPEGDNYSYLNE